MPSGTQWYEQVATVESGKQAEANARLIAKAPELLIAAIAYRNHLKTAASTEGEVRTYEHLCDLIAQATGE